MVREKKILTKGEEKFYFSMLNVLFHAILVEVEVLANRRGFKKDKSFMEFYKFLCEWKKRDVRQYSKEKVVERLQVLLQENKPYLERLKKLFAVFKKYRDFIVQHNTGLVYHLAREQPHFPELAFDDLIQEGMFGLMLAVYRFNPFTEDEVKFSTYASWWIVQRMKRFILTTRKVITYPSHFMETHLKVYNLVKNNPDITPEEIHKELGIPIEKVIVHLSHLDNVIYIDFYSSDEEKDHLTDRLYLEVNRSVEEDFCRLIESPSKMVEEKANAEYIKRQVFSVLSPREEMIIRKRFGIGYRKHTLEEIAKEFKLSKERIRQLEKNALIKMRRFLEEVIKNENLTVNIEK